jgi:hypothetical protein
MPNNVSDWGLYIPTTTILDVGILQDVDVNSPDFKELLVRLYQTVNNIAVATNLKTTGYYFTQEFNTGQLLFNPTNDITNLRSIYRTTINFGALPAAGTKSVAHGIPNIGNPTTYSAVKVYGAATNQTTSNFIPIPYSSATSITDNLELWIDDTNVNIATGGNDYSAYTITYVTFEYVKE